jgi:hypothetical protein
LAGLGFASYRIVNEQMRGMLPPFIKHLSINKISLHIGKLSEFLNARVTRRASPADLERRLVGAG